MKKTVIIALTISSLFISTVKIEFCDLCKHYHIDGVCEEAKCECNADIEIKPFGYVEWDDDL